MRGMAIAGSRTLALGLGLLVLAGCAETLSDRPENTRPPPAGLAPPEEAADPQAPSARSRALARYYAGVEADLLAQGLLRTGGGGIDTPFAETDILRNFERIVFFDEYARNRGLTRSNGKAGRLRKWTEPVRMAVEFGNSVPAAQRRRDRRMVTGYAARLATITGHSITTGGRRANFNVLIMGEDDRAQTLDRIRQIVPGVNPASLQLIETLPRSIHCLVMAFSGPDNDYRYRRAVALIRAEHPDLMRRSCVHEELAQGLGLANDSPRARPSIFNDDDEFALLTTHDEELLRILYNPALTPGMTADEARPIVRRLLTGLDGPA